LTKIGPLGTQIRLSARLVSRATNGHLSKDRSTIVGPSRGFVAAQEPARTDCPTSDLPWLRAALGSARRRNSLSMRCPDIARSAHAADDAAVCHQLLELFAGMVGALIRVMQQRVGLAVRAHPAHAAINPQKVSIALHPGPAQPIVAKMVSENKSNTEPDRIRTPAVDLQHLRYAVAAADHGSFRRAADALLLRQSTLSRWMSPLAQDKRS
jgi:hypothetical protein